MTKLLNRMGDKMLATMLPKSKASACSIACRFAYTGCGGGTCVYYWNKYVSGGQYCFAMRENSCYSTPYSTRSGCC